MSFLGSILNPNSPYFPGGVPRSDGDPLKFLSADGTFKGPGSSLGGTVTSITFDAPLGVGGVPGATITTSGHATIGVFDATHSGIVPASTGGTVKFLRADGTWADPAGSGSDAVSLQTLTPGTPDTGNFNISGTGIVGTKFAVGNPALGSGKFLISKTGGSGGDVLLEILDPSDVDTWQIFGDGSATIASTTTGEAVAIAASGLHSTALLSSSNSGYSGLFQSGNAANTFPTVFIQGLAGATVPLLSLHGNSHLDNATSTRISLSDTNTATTLSNACIVFQPQAGAAGRLAIFVGGTDNDTPGAFDTISMTGADGVTYVNFPALGGSQGDQVFQVGGPVYIDGLLTANAGITTGSGTSLFGGAVTINNDLTVANNIDLSSSGTIVNWGAALNLGNQGITNPGTITGGNFNVTLGSGTLSTTGFVKTTGAGTAQFDGSGGLTVGSSNATIDSSGNIVANGTAGIQGQVAIGSTTIGSHALDVTGDAGFTDQIISTLAIGTAPLVVTSTTPVANLTLSADSQLPTISTAGKVSNSATTATVASTASTIALRGADGSLTATAFITGSLQAAFTASPYGASAGQTGEMRFLELIANGSNYVGFKAPDGLGGNLMYTLPTTDAAGPLMSNGSGILNPVAGASLTILVPVANKTLTFTNGVLMSAV